MRALAVVVMVMVACSDRASTPVQSSPARGSAAPASVGVTASSAGSAASGSGSGSAAAAADRKAALEAAKQAAAQQADYFREVLGKKGEHRVPFTPGPEHQVVDDTPRKLGDDPTDSDGFGFGRSGLVHDDIPVQREGGFGHGRGSGSARQP